MDLFLLSVIGALLGLDRCLFMSTPGNVTQYCGRQWVCLLPSSEEGSSQAAWRGPKGHRLNTQQTANIISWTKISCYALVHTWVTRAWFWAWQMASAPTLGRQEGKCASTGPLLSMGGAALPASVLGQETRVMSAACSTS